MRIRDRLLLLGGLLVAIYGSHLSAAWVYEDSAARADWSRPLTALTWMFTQTPLAAHAFNIGLHGIVGLSAGLLAVRLGLSRTAAWWVAALVIAHPLAEEAVAYAAARSELLAALGVIWACLAITVQDITRWPLVFLALAFGLASKETAIVAVALVPLTAVITRQRIDRDTWAWYGMTVWLATLAVLAFRIDPMHYGATWLLNYGEAPNMTITAGAWLLGQATAIYRLLGVALTGHGMTVDADIDLYGPPAQIIALVACSLISLWPLTLWRHKPVAAFGLTWAILSVLPRLIIQTPRSYLNEHQAYTPLIGLILAGMAWWDSQRQLA